MKNKFMVAMDGGEARMIVAALCEKSFREKGLARDMNWILAMRIDQARQQWHEEAKKHIDEGQPFGDVNEHDAVMAGLDAVKRQIGAGIETKGGVRMNVLQLNEYDEINEMERDRFHIDSIDQVNWAFRKIAALKAKQTEINDLAAAEIHRITKWSDTESGKLTDNISFFEGLLTEYALTQRHADPTFKKASTPYGSVKFKKQQAKWIYDDAALVESLKANGLDELVRIKEEPNKAELKKRFVTGSDGEVVDPETGALIDGVRVEEMPDEVKVEVDG